MRSLLVAVVVAAVVSAPAPARSLPGGKDVRCLRAAGWNAALERQGGRTVVVASHGTTGWTLDLARPSRSGWTSYGHGPTAAEQRVPRRCLHA